MKDKQFDTRAVHFQSKEPARNTSKAKPIYQTSAFVFKDLDDMESFYEGEKEYLYSRYSNPNTDDLGQGIALLENAEDGVATSSGMAAILAGVLAVAKHGDHILASEDLYGGTYQLFADEVASLGIEVEFVSFEELANVKGAIKSNTVLLYTESVTNPLLRVEDVEGVIQLGKDSDVKVMIDNTFATPYLLQPYVLGADLVIHSATKYIGGHSDVTAGVLVGHESLLAKARSKIVTMGCNLSPFEAWLACRGLKTLSIRMDKQSRNAQALAHALEEDPNVQRVYYPDFVSEKGNGAMVSVDLADHVDVEVFFKSLDWIKIAPTLAGVETTVSYPLRTSHRTIPKELQQELGIGKQLVRISVGIEDEKDIVETFKKAIRLG
ncbi:PLP-dependent aspartate aminotransferase family protein [Halalkalibacter sp. APA_J-10(15)]|uniref:trans-sulfuration enzyme family protein n=1 Tax=unclassified Halalkalibacter TaxID=2893063 RepID=UPI001FF32118|nr:aminotransferase class I/II-fold pyridoxal phosphate-dependent enzyme [Halalkalibacter sp. APA_J-10(15)]MCK0473424.1 aminotransferase class I/II-fold pyridoxal phosphate-dependent enzyme [Halalkalibacter sp. APA_J-10(15)]